MALAAISFTVALISSAALATEATLLLISSAAELTIIAWALVWVAPAASWVATSVSSAADFWILEPVSTMWRSTSTARAFSRLTSAPTFKMPSTRPRSSRIGQ